MINLERRNEGRLKIDNVLSTQPELGPSIPDGGYGWIILVATLFFQLLVPSIIIAYGVFLVFLRIENSAPAYPELWDNPLVYAPLLFVATWTLVDPWIRSIISNSIWPRLVATAGTSLTCSGLLFIWLAISHGSRTAPWFIVSGILSGLGASIVMAQCEIILAQYFRVKLKHVNTCIQVTVSLGFVLTPIVLGNHILKDGLLSVILWYQIIILQGLVVCLFIRKPPYLKGTGKNYRLVQGMADDEIDIFAKNTTELQNTRHSTSTIEEMVATIEDNHEGISTITTTTTTTTTTSSLSNGGIHLTNPPATHSKQKPEENLIDIEIHAVKNNWDSFGDNSLMSGKRHWEIFEDNTSDKNNGKAQQNQQETTNTDLDKIETFEDNFTQVPKPLFTETQVNNNNTYSFDNVEANEEPVVFMPVNNSTAKTSFLTNISFLKQPTFYKSLLQIITLKFSIFTFFALFPSHLYMRITSLKVHHATSVVGYLSISAMVFSLVLPYINATSYRRALLLWTCSWFGALGFIMMSDVRSETVLIIGSIFVILSIQSLQYFGAPLQKLGLRGETSRVHVFLNVLTALTFFIFLIADMSYVNCFRMMALLHFVTGGIWFANYIFKQMKPIVSRSGGQ